MSNKVSHIVTCEGKSITVSGSEFSFKYAIKKWIKCSGFVIVLLEHPMDPEDNENVYCISCDSKKIVRIKKTKGYDRSSVSSYVDIGCVDGVVVAWNWSGFRVSVDAFSGSITSWHETK